MFIKNILSKQKAVSPLIATVLIVAFTIAVAMIVVSALTSVTKQQTEAVTAKEACARAALDIIARSCSNDVITAIIQNIGTGDLTNFTIFANINNQLYTNTSPSGGNSVLTPGGLLTLNAYTTYNGSILKLRVSAGNCPVGIEVTNETTVIGTC